MAFTISTSVVHLFDEAFGGMRMNLTQAWRDLLCERESKIILK